MGIRFLCEHCQQLLNVKAHQAGEEGVCPKCEQPIRVPEKSTALSPVQVAARNRKQSELRARRKAIQGHPKTVAELHRSQDLDQLSSPQSQTVQPAADATGPFAHPATLSDVAAQSGDLPGQGNFLLDKPVNPWLQPNAPDPLETGIKKIWYVRHPQAGEEGPIKGKRIAKMLKDKKIVAGCFVWREDWEDWIRAELLFRELMPDNPAAPDDRLFTDPNASIAKSYLKKAQAQANTKKRRLALGVVAIVVGIVTIAFLVWLLTTMW